MIPTKQLGKPIRQDSYDLCGIAAYVTAVRAFCGTELIGFLHDIWEQEPVTVEPTDEATLREFYQKYGQRLFGSFRWDGNGLKMFQWLNTIQGPSFRNANMHCSFGLFPPSQFAALENHLVKRPAIACIAIAFDARFGPACHVVNVWHNAEGFHLRDSARSTGDLSDGKKASLIQAVELTGFRQWPNGQITGGMAVTSKFG